MTRTKVTFLAAGVTAGVITTLIGQLWPAFLAFGVGVVFSGAVVAAIALTGCWPGLQSGLWRVIAAICICSGAYVLALATFAIVGGYWAEVLHVRVSAEVRTGVDLWIGLLAAALVASACIEFLVYVLTGTWSNSFLLWLAAAGAITTLLTFLLNKPDHSYWRFFGVLLPVGEGLFCTTIGAQIWKISQGSAVRCI